MNEQQIRLRFMCLKEILQSFSISNDTFCIGGYTDGGICIERVNDQWMVYFGIRYEYDQLASFFLDDMDDACLLFLHRIVQENVEFSQLQEMYFQKLIKKRLKHSS